MIDLSAIRAIDFHTHAEEPCGCHADDGYDDLQAAMARYVRASWQHPPTIDETARRSTRHEDAWARAKRAV